MTCEHFLDLMAEYLAGAVAPDEFEAHLVECGWCLDYLHSYVETVRLTKAVRAGDAPASPDAVENLVKYILAARPPSGL